MNIKELNETEQLKLRLAQAHLEASALRFAANPKDMDFMTFLYCEAHEFGNALHEIGWDEMWLSRIIDVGSCDDKP